MLVCVLVAAILLILPVLLSMNMEGPLKSSSEYSNVAYLLDSLLRGFSFEFKSKYASKSSFPTKRGIAVLLLASAVALLLSITALMVVERKMARKLDEYSECRE